MKWLAGGLVVFGVGLLGLAALEFFGSGTYSIGVHVVGVEVNSSAPFWMTGGTGLALLLGGAGLLKGQPRR